jgi:hypothetical protein
VIGDFNSWNESSSSKLSRPYSSSNLQISSERRVRIWRALVMLEARYTTHARLCHIATGSFGLEKSSRASVISFSSMEQARWWASTECEQSRRSRQASAKERWVSGAMSSIICSMSSVGRRCIDISAGESVVLLCVAMLLVWWEKSSRELALCVSGDVA